MNFLHSLQSSDSSEVIDALYGLSSSGKDEVTSDIFAVLTNLVVHHDPEVREQVAVAGIRLRLPDLYPLFFQRLQGLERESSVLPPLIDAVTVLALHGVGRREELSRVLGRYVLDEHEDDEVRGTAYLALLRLWDRISAREYAIAPRGLSEMKCDLDFVSQLVC